MKLALGTVQFGLNYGIANDGDQVSLPEVAKILNRARQCGVDMLDTAIAYGNSETCLGKVGIDDFKLVTKLPISLDDDVENFASRHLSASLKRLCVDRVHGLLLHRPEQLLGPRGPELAKSLNQLKDDGLVSKIGVSIYTPDELDAVTQVCAIDLVQAPFNLFDQRLLTSGWLQRLHDAGVEIHARSIFLQGLLLMPRHRIPDQFVQWSSIFNRWHEWLNDGHATAVEACIAFVNQPMIDRVVVGVDSMAQLDELLQATSKPYAEILPDLSCNDEKLINPSNWNLL